MRFFEFRNIIKEARFGLRSEKGEVPFRTSKTDDPHILDAINKIAQDTGSSVNDMLETLKVEQEMTELLGQYSKLLHDVATKNVGEHAIWNIVDAIPTEKLKSSFDELTFIRLCQEISKRSKGFFPLKSVDKNLHKKLISELHPILIPSTYKQYQQYNNLVDTAAVSQDGNFFFNVHFMEKLIYFGDTINVKPTRPIYVSNGGDIPDIYCYIEFLIMHELCHFIFGDIGNSLKYKQYEHRLHNLAQDFRINYELTKLGYTPIPLGMFSDDLNADRFSNYIKLLRSVDEEVKKLPPWLRTWFEKTNSHDQHTDPKNPDTQGGGPNIPWKPALGDIVLIAIKGEFGRVVGIKPGDMYEVIPVSIPELQQEYPGIKVGTAQDIKESDKKGNRT